MLRISRLLSVRLARLAALLALLFVAAGATTAWGQQTVPFAGGVPVPPSGLEARTVPAAPVVIDTAEGERVRVVPVAKNIAYPSSLGFLADGTVLVTTRTGQLLTIRNDRLDPTPVAGTPAAYWAGESGRPGAVHGYMDIALHPRFAENRLVYLAYTKPIDEKQRVVAIARGRLDGQTMSDVRDIFVLEGGGVSRMAFGRDGTLFITTSGRDPQDPNTQGGKVLRINDDGSIPADNPFVGRPGHRPEIYTLGHRSAPGLALHPGTGEMWQNEHGPNGGDEINVLKPGANYGWPLVSYGRTYQGPWQSDRFWREGFETPIVYWMPSIAVSGMMFYTGDRFPKWKGDVFVGALRMGEIPGTGHIERILFNEKMEELRREILLLEFRQRVRDIRQSPDGLIYLVTDEKDGAVVRLEPAD